MPRFPVPIALEDSAVAPSAPPSGYQLIYFRSGTLYAKTPAGVETAVGGGVAGAMTVATVTGSTTAANNSVYLASGTFTVTLPSAASGNHVIVKNTGTGTITVAPPSGTIDGAANFVLDTQYESIELYSDATNYWVV